MYDRASYQYKDKAKSPKAKAKQKVLKNIFRQGTIGNDWPYSKIPFSASGDFSNELISVINVNLEENIWNYRDGKDNFDDCINGLNISKCSSIFDPRPNV